MNIFVIGGGPGGYVAAIRAAQLGATVTLVEKENMGGTCLNIGCIPTKALLETADYAESASISQQYGVKAELTVDFAQAQKRKQQIVGQLVGGVTGLMRANKITVIKGTAHLASSKSLTVDGKTYNFDKLIIAAGSMPATVPIKGIDAPQCIDSTQALSLEQVPESMVIIGGGVIGVEMASIYRALGCKVTIVEMQPEILPTMDKELATMLRGELAKKGIEILTNAQVLSIENKGALAEVTVKTEKESQLLSGEKVLVSVGRKANTEVLQLSKAGIKEEKGNILVNLRQETNVAGIYAIGDCTGGAMLAHVASAQGEVAAENAMGGSAEYSGKTVASCVYTNPEFAGVGLTEEQLKEKGIEYDTGKFPLMANGKALIVGSGGMVKVLADKKYGEILGIHMLGASATELISEGALALGTEATLDEIIATNHPHPTVGESIREAALAARNRAIHITNK